MDVTLWLHAFFTSALHVVRPTLYTGRLFWRDQSPVGPHSLSGEFLPLPGVEVRPPPDRPARNVITIADLAISATFRRVRIIAKSDHDLRPVCPHGKPRLQLDGFS
jgi:hypothetical protein